MLFSWFRSKASSPRQARAAKVPQRPRYHKCQLELLEDRTLLSSMFLVDRPGDAGLGDNGTNAINQAGGDIRYCIDQANFPDKTGVTTITFAASLNNSTITLTQGELKIFAVEQVTNTIIAATPSQNITISGGDIILLAAGFHTNPKRKRGP